MNFVHGLSFTSPSSPHSKGDLPPLLPYPRGLRRWRRRKREGGWCCRRQIWGVRPLFISWTLSTRKLGSTAATQMGKKFVHLATHLSSLSIFLTLRSLTRGHLFPLQLCFRRRPTKFSCLVFFFPSSVFSNFVVASSSRVIAVFAPAELLFHVSHFPLLWARGSEASVLKQEHERAFSLCSMPPQTTTGR